jgi:hypothetical protein
VAHRLSIRFLPVLLMVFAAAMSAQRLDPVTLEGGVFDAESHSALAGVTVELRNDSMVGIKTTTDRTGRFFFSGVAAGSYRLLASHSEYVRSEYAPLSSEVPQPLIIRPGQAVTGIQLPMIRGGVIAGRVLDRGRPVINVHVAVGKISYESGKRIWKKILSYSTNDRGEYSIFWLPPGRYYVMADFTDTRRLPPPVLFLNPGGGDNPLLYRGLAAMGLLGRAQASPPTFVRSRIAGGVNDAEMHVPMFFPHAPDWREATPIEISPGARVDNVDIDASPVAALHVRGMVSGAPFTNPQGEQVRPTIALYRAETISATADAMGVQRLLVQPHETTQADPNGLFDFPRVPRGRYVLHTGFGILAGRETIEVLDQDINGVTIAVAPGRTVTGRIVFEEGSVSNPGSIVTSLTVGLRMESPDQFSLSRRPAPDETFSMMNVPSGNFQVWVAPIRVLRGTGSALSSVPPALQNIYVKSIMMGQTDVLNTGIRLPGSLQPIVITLGANPGNIEGRVLDGPQTRAGTRVVLVPEGGQRAHVHHKSTSSDESGRFQFTRVPPGEYKLFAWERVEPGAWENEEFLRQYESRGAAVRVVEGQTATAEVTLLR